MNWNEIFLACNRDINIGMFQIWSLNSIPTGLTNFYKVGSETALLVLIGQICEIELDYMFCTPFGGCMISTVFGNAILMIFKWHLHIIGAGKGKKSVGVNWTLWWTGFVHLVGCLVSRCSSLWNFFITAKKWVF